MGGVESISFHVQDESLHPLVLFLCGTTVPHCLSGLSSSRSLSLSCCLIGTYLPSRWRCLQIQLVCVTLGCRVLLSNGWPQWPIEQLNTHTHSLPRDSLFIPCITILCVPQRIRGGFALLCHPGVPSKRLGIAFSALTNGLFPFPSTLKRLRD